MYICKYYTRLEEQYRLLLKEVWLHWYTAVILLISVPSWRRYWRAILSFSRAHCRLPESRSCIVETATPVEHLPPSVFKGGKRYLSIEGGCAARVTGHIFGYLRKNRRMKQHRCAPGYAIPLILDMTKRLYAQYRVHFHNSTYSSIPPLAVIEPRDHRCCLSSPPILSSASSITTEFPRMT